MSARNARRLLRMAELVDQEWAPGGTGAGMSLNGYPGSPCVEDRGVEVGIPKRVLTRYGLRNEWNDARGRTAEQVAEALREAAAAEDGRGVVVEKPERVSRKHPGAAPVASGSRLITASEAAAMVAGLAAILLAVHFAEVLVLFLELLVLAVAGGASSWGLYRLACAIDWPHVRAWWGRNRARAVARRRVRDEVAQARRPIALGPIPTTTTDDALRAAWTTEREESAA